MGRTGAIMPVPAEAAHTAPHDLDTRMDATQPGFDCG